MRLELEILWHTDESRELSELGIESCSYTTRKVIFYDIACIHKYEDTDGSIKSKVYSGYESFICVLPVETVDRLIQEQLCTG